MNTYKKSNKTIICYNEKKMIKNNERRNRKKVSGKRDKLEGEGGVCREMES